MAEWNVGKTQKRKCAYGLDFSVLPYHVRKSRCSKKVNIGERETYYLSVQLAPYHTNNRRFAKSATVLTLPSHIRDVTPSIYGNIIMKT